MAILILPGTLGEQLEIHVSVKGSSFPQEKNRIATAKNRNVFFINEECVCSVLFELFNDIDCGRNVRK